MAGLDDLTFRQAQHEVHHVRPAYAASGHGPVSTFETSLTSGSSG